MKLSTIKFLCFLQFIKKKRTKSPKKINNNEIFVSRIIYLVAIPASVVSGLVVDYFGRNVQFVILSIIMGLVGHCLLAFTFLSPYIATVISNVSRWITYKQHCTYWNFDEGFIGLRVFFTRLRSLAVPSLHYTRAHDGHWLRCNAINTELWFGYFVLIHRRHSWQWWIFGFRIIFCCRFMP